ncbi:hypothetical protein PFISCL1PPCAC_27504, partial [Pristionchus fissidentatus]
LQTEGEDEFNFNPQNTQPPVTSSYGYSQYSRNESLSQNESREESEEKRAMWELVQRQTMQDYTTICASLQIPLNIDAWTPDQSARWILSRV